MNNTQTAHSIILLLALPAVIAAGCSELKDTLPNASTASLSVHPNGWTTTVSANFHGKSIREDNWDMRSCQTCHGKYYNGGIAQVACTQCHKEPAGPENCTTCHGGANAAPPRDLTGGKDRSLKTVGAHQIHYLGSSLSGPILCSECHKVPATVYDPGHVDSGSPAEVAFNNVLTNTKTGIIPGGPTVTPQPSHNPGSATCANTYCHGAFVNGNTTFAPVWNDPTGTQMACGTCHGDVTKPTLAERALPKTSARGGTHPNFTACNICHDDVVDANLRIINPAKHINGKLNVAGEERSF